MAEINFKAYLNNPGGELHDVTADFSYQKEAEDDAKEWLNNQEFGASAEIIKSETIRVFKVERKIVRE